ncbi:MAG TPA: DUF1080 domain-containing protein [Bryobacteraceae bacterium]
MMNRKMTTPAVAAAGLLVLAVWVSRPSNAQRPAGHAPAHHRHFGFTQPDPINFNDHAGWTSIFDGKDLKGWSGDTHYWHVENGAITVESTCEKPTGTIYLVWQGGHPANFKLKLEMKGQGANVNSGIQYRGAIQKPKPAPASARRHPSGACPDGHPRGTPPSRASQAKWDMMGPQFDFDGRNNFTGQFYEQGTGRGIIAWRGQVVQTEQDQHPRLLAMLGNPKALGGFVNIDGWNQLLLIARGHQMTHILNGHVMSILFDDDPTYFRKSGLIGFEIEGTGKVSIRDIWIKKLP